jgi:hypothetical protein
VVCQDVAVHVSVFCEVILARRGQTRNAFIMDFLMASGKSLVSFTVTYDVDLLESLGAGK